MPPKKAVGQPRRRRQEAEEAEERDDDVGSASTGSGGGSGGGDDAALRAKARQQLKQLFGFDSFREGQEDVVLALMRGESALFCASTGQGKSLCYQLPACMLALEGGLTVFVSRSSPS